MGSSECGRGNGSKGCLQTTSRMSSRHDDDRHGGRGSGDGQTPPAGDAASDAAFPTTTGTTTMEPSQGAEGVLPAMTPAQRTLGAVGPRQGLIHDTHPKKVRKGAYR